MNRYAVISKGLSISQLKEEVLRVGGRNISILSITKQIYCLLDDDAVRRLGVVPGLMVKTVGVIKHQEMRAPALQELPSQFLPATYSASKIGVFSGFYDFRNAWTPAVTGRGGTIALLDSGIRRTHEGLQGKVIYEEDFTGQGTTEDLFDHGTGVAYVAAGGRHAVEEESGLAPDAYLWNMRVLDENGEGSEENVVRALERCYELELEANEKGLSPDDPMDLNFVNMSFGSEDTGDPDNPIRAAIRQSVEAFGGLTYFVYIAAAGNGGPELGTITCPACDPNVIAVGASTFSPFRVWEQSSRGPTKEGLIKPDFCGFGVRTLTASAAGDDKYVVKSGTSFSAPACCGGMAAVWEGMTRQYGVRFWEEFYERGAEGVLELGSRICVKPEDAPPGKDNDYGYGLVSGLAALQAGKAAVGMDLSSVTQIVVPVISLGMVGMMMSTMAKGMK